MIRWEVQKTEAQNLPALLASPARPGDALVFAGRMEALRWFISRAQVRMLRDLYYNMSKEDARYYARFSHTACMLSCFTFGEMYRPHARVSHFVDIPRGTTILIRRPLKAMNNDCIGQKIVEACLRDIDNQTGYPIRELFYYYFWSWHVQKFWLGRKFADIFRSRKSDVCSGRYIYWCHNADILSREMPEAWYPARIAVDTQYFVTVLAVEIT